MGREDLELAGKLAERGIRDARVLEAIARLDRRAFVPDASQAEAGQDAALPIGWGQTISQPYVVAYMSEALGVRPGMRILEIGTGSGYQAAVLVELGAEVYSIERVPDLAEEARGRLEGLGYRPPRLHLRRGDGTAGWPEAAPFDAVMVTAAAESVPPALVAQLRVGGRLIAPIGPPDAQQLILLERTLSGVRVEWKLPVRFVPLVEDERPVSA